MQHQQLLSELPPLSPPRLLFATTHKCAASKTMHDVSKQLHAFTRLLPVVGAVSHGHSNQLEPHPGDARAVVWHGPVVGPS